MTIPKLIPATLADYPIIQNMARFYLYDMARYCASISHEWNIPKDGLYECFDFQKYFTDSTRKAFLIKVGDALAGFVLLDKNGKSKDIDWNIGEFFILAQFQGKGLAEHVAYEIWHMFPGIWEVSVIPENVKALAFWRKTIAGFTHEKYEEEIKRIAYDEHQPNRYILTFDTKAHLQSKLDIQVYKVTEKDIDAMVELSYQKRREYEKAQPRFWKYAKGAEAIQAKWFKELLDKDDWIMLAVYSSSSNLQGLGISESRSDVAISRDPRVRMDLRMMGFCIGRIIPAPEVYDPSGLTLMIDDFCVYEPSKWKPIATALISEIKLQAKAKGCSQIVIVAGAHDEPKRQFLKSLGLSVASEWYVGEV